MVKPEIAVLVSSFERPGHLHRVLESIACQRGVEKKFEVVVTDDGSRDETIPMIQSLAKRSAFPLTVTTHEHSGFQLARCRNEGVAASQAPYILFLDGDCLIPPDHLRWHLARRAQGVVQAGYCARLNREVSERITIDSVRNGEFVKFASWRELWPLFRLDISSRFYNAFRDRKKPRLFGGNIGIWRADYERVNGYDENFVGWGCEDDDLRLRLRQTGVRIESILRWTRTYHIWHPKVDSAPEQWSQGENVSYLRRPYRLACCGNGLVKRQVRDLDIRIVGSPQNPAALAAVLPPWFRDTKNDRTDPAEIELLFLPGRGAFSTAADCRIAVILESTSASIKQAKMADMIVSRCPIPRLEPREWFPLEQLDWALESLVARNRAVPTATAASGDIVRAA